MTHDPAMARTRSIPDQQVLGIVLDLLMREGDKAVTFSRIAADCGLAGPTLVQRYGSRDGMVEAALVAGWDRLDAATEAAEADALVSGKGVQALLKALSLQHSIPGLLAASFRDEALRERARHWRARVEQALAVRLGSGSKGREAAALVFAAWQGRMQWDVAGGKGFRLGEALKKLS